jgi:hypothetical protein
MDSVYIIETFDAWHTDARPSDAQIIKSIAAIRETLTLTKVWLTTHGFKATTIVSRYYNEQTDRYATFRKFPFETEAAATIPDPPRLLKSWPVSLKFDGLREDRFLGTLDVFDTSTAADVARALAIRLRKAADDLEREAS